MSAARRVVVLAGVLASGALALAQAPPPAAPPAAPTRWTLVGAHAEVRVAGSRTGPDGARTTNLVLRGPRACEAPADGVDGQCVVAFGADALGKPEPLRFAVPPGADVHVAVEAAGPAPLRDVAPDGDAWSEAPAPAMARVTGDAEQRDYRVEASWNAPASAADVAIGLVARWVGPDDHYAFVCDASGGFRLERRMGGYAMTINSVPAVPRVPTAPLRLAFEVNGFRLRGFVGDAVVVEALDGALTNGRFGWCWKGARPELASMTVGPPAPPRTSVALVRARDGAATLHVAGPLPPGHRSVLELRLDRPGPLLPLTDAGLESWLLHRAVAPHVLLADLAGSLGRGTFGEVPERGQLDTAIAWPDLPALRGHVALVRLLFVASDGSVVAAATPAASLRL